MTQTMKEPVLTRLDPYREGAMTDEATQPSDDRPARTFVEEVELRAAQMRDRTEHRAGRHARRALLWLTLLVAAVTVLVSVLAIVIV